MQNYSFKLGVAKDGTSIDSGDLNSKKYELTGNKQGGVLNRKGSIRPLLV